MGRVAVRLPALGALCALLPAGLAACPYPDGDGGTGGTAPRITSSFPAPGTQILVRDGSLTFSATGEDDDSLDLSWEWSLDGEPAVFGSTEDGVFDQSWTLYWDESLAGLALDVAFYVSDGTYSADLFWPVDAGE